MQNAPYRADSLQRLIVNCDAVWYGTHPEHKYFVVAVTVNMNSRSSDIPWFAFKLNIFLVSLGDKL
jgi:hypothetical protein